MASTVLNSLLLAAALAAVTGLAVRIILPRLPEPAGETGGKIPYAELADSPMLASCMGISALGGWGLGWFVPWQLWPVWLGWLTLGLLLVAIDARTTWLPLVLTRPLWLLTAASVVITWPLAGWQTSVRMLIAAACVGGFFALFWWLRPHALGFGDVRLAPVIGAVAGSISVDAVFVALLIGTVLGAVSGIIVRLRGRQQAFPYGPPLWLGTVALLPLAPALG